MVIPCDLYRNPVADGDAVQSHLAAEDEGLVRFVAQLVSVVVVVCRSLPEARVHFGELLRPMLDRGRPT